MSAVDKTHLKIPSALNVNQFNQANSQLEQTEKDLDRVSSEEDSNFRRLKDERETALLTAKVAECQLEIIENLMLQPAGKRDFSRIDRITEAKKPLIEEFSKAKDDLPLLPLDDDFKEDDSNSAIQLKKIVVEESSEIKKARIIRKLDQLFSEAQEEMQGLNQNTNLKLFISMFKTKISKSHEKCLKVAQEVKKSGEKIKNIKAQQQAIDLKLKKLVSLDIWIASELGDTDLIGEQIRQSPGSVNQKNSEDFTPLHLAAAQGHSEVVQALLDAHADPTIEDKEKWLPLHWAAKGGNVPTATILLGQPRTHANPKNEFGQTPLHIAASNGKDAMIEFLLSQRAFINDKAQGRSNVTPLHEAVMKGHKKAVQALVNDPRLDTNILDAKGYSALHYSAEQQHFDITALIIAHQSWKWPPECTFNEAIALMNVFLNGNFPASYERKNAEAIIAQTILAHVPDLLFDRGRFIQILSSNFSRQGVKIDKLKRFKTVICETLKSSNWENGILGIYPDKITDHHTVFFSYNNALENPITVGTRSVFFQKSPGSLISVAYGSTFATNIEGRKNPQGDHLLDAVFGQVCLDKNGKFEGFALGLADGAGGHYLNTKEDKMIGKTANVAARTCVRLLSTYHTPEKLSEDLKGKILDMTEKRIQVKGLTGGTTLLGCRVFPDLHGFRVVSMNIGDNLLIAWDPQRKRAYHLSPSNKTEQGTALIPQGYRSHEIQITDVVVPRKSLLFLISNGIHDTLPFDEEKLTYPNGLKYSMKTLSQLQIILGDFPDNTDPETYLRALVKKSIEEAEAVRRQHLDRPNVKIGDDFSILQCVLDN